ncbi:glycine oxidase ThiO [Paenibacillus campi]|uniref:glycine oxidase ThiO n=1 Tax=Paenibacillus campi TaxID=3106031 RepID=UPI002AFFCD75|nr:glycine oxidase ThiO [Paenibacillus sp. SGZ-1014]
MKSNGHYDVIVVGGGVIGASIAFELAGKGATVALIEKHQPASGASGAAGGMLAASSEHFAAPELYQLALQSRALYPTLSERLQALTGIDVGLRTEGFLLPIHRHTNADWTKDSHHIAEAHAKGMEWWDNTRLAIEEPYVHAEDGMLYNAAEPQLVPTLLNEAYVAAFARLGGVFYRDHEVIRLLREPDGRGAVQGVITEQRLMYADQVVLASGLGTARLLAGEGWRLPFLPVKGELLEIRTPLPWLQHTIFGETVYIIPKHPHRIWIGATSKPGQYDTTVEAGAIVELLMKAQRYIPMLAKGELVRCWAGVRPGTPDELPYIGAVDELPGLWIAAGHYRNGILLSAGTAKLMSEAIAQGNAALIPPAFRPERALVPLPPAAYAYHHTGITSGHSIGELE